MMCMSIRKIVLTLVGVLCGMLTSNLAFAGGVVPTYLGMYHDGRVVDYVPASDRLIRWTYYGSRLSDTAKDIAAYALASVDYETLDFRILYGGDAPSPEVIVFWSFNDYPVTPGCTDTVAGNCVLASTECLASIKQGKYRLCSSYKVQVNVNNIQQTTDAGLSWETRLYKIVRHEQGHVMGLWHDGHGPMANGALPFTACQLAAWQDFYIDEYLTTWEYPVVPECVEPAAARQAQQVFSCPDVI